MKIGVLGGGTAGAISILSMLEVLYDTRNLDKVQITCIHDSNTPITTVGESASTAVYRLLFRLLNFNIVEDMHKIDGSIRYYTKYFWEKANDKNFTVNYGYPGLHLNSEKFSKFVLDELIKSSYNINVVDDRIESVENKKVVCSNGEYEFDYIIDCLGTPKNFDEYEVPDFIGVNSAVIYPHFHEYNETFTSAYVHENGWMFGVPLSHRKAFGFCYNNDYLTVEEAKEKFAEIMPIIEKDKLRQFTWKQYYRKKAYEDNVLYMGNKLYFFEPHQAIPLHYYLMITQEFIKAAINNWQDLDGLLNSYHQMSMKEIQDLIALNYAGKNNIDSPFWNDRRKQAIEKLKSSEMTFVAWARAREAGGHFDFWAQDPKIMDQYIKGFDIDIEDIIRYI